MEETTRVRYLNKNGDLDCDEIDDSFDLARLLIALGDEDGPEGYHRDIAVTADGDLILSDYLSTDYWDLDDSVREIGRITWHGGGADVQTEPCTGCGCMTCHKDKQVADVRYYSSDEHDRSWLLWRQCPKTGDRWREVCWDGASGGQILDGWTE